MNIEMKTGYCMMCGTSKALTVHHGIPKHLQPKSNVLVQVCRDCHTKINKVDTGALASYIYKIMKIMEDKSKALKGILNILKEQKNNEKMLLDKIKVKK